MFSTSHHKFSAPVSYVPLCFVWLNQCSMHVVIIFLITIEELLERKLVPPPLNPFLDVPPGRYQVVFILEDSVFSSTSS